MYTKQRPPYLRRRLRTMRERADLSMKEAAARLDMSRTSLFSRRVRRVPRHRAPDPFGDGSLRLLRRRSLALLDLPDEDDPPIRYVDHVAGSLHIENPGQVRMANEVFDRLRAQALSPADSVEAIEEVLEEFDSR